ncbi:MAG: hypothetical protein U9Q04_06865 [Campylobacterota bacterium]|nr:hypothetical protein [Campylobacterota bacterium]
MKFIFKNEKSLYNFNTKPIAHDGLTHNNWSFSKRQNESLFGSLLVAVVISLIVYFTFLI